MCYPFLLLSLMWPERPKHNDQVDYLNIILYGEMIHHLGFSSSFFPI